MAKSSDEAVAPPLPTGRVTKKMLGAGCDESPQATAFLEAMETARQSWPPSAPPPARISPRVPSAFVAWRGALSLTSRSDPTLLVVNENSPSLVALDCLISCRVAEARAKKARPPKAPAASVLVHGKELTSCDYDRALTSATGAVGQTAEMASYWATAVSAHQAKCKVDSEKKLIVLETPNYGALCVALTYIAKNGSLVVPCPDSYGVLLLLRVFSEVIPLRADTASERGLCVCRRFVGMNKSIRSAFLGALHLRLPLGLPPEKAREDFLRDFAAGREAALLAPEGVAQGPPEGCGKVLRRDDPAKCVFKRDLARHAFRG